MKKLIKKISNKDAMRGYAVIVESMDHKLDLVLENQTERFERVETALIQVLKDTTAMKEDISVLKDDVSVLKKDVSVLKKDVSVLKDDVSTLKTDVSVLKDDMSVVKQTVGIPEVLRR